MKSLDGCGGLESQFEAAAPIRGAGVGVEDVVERAVAHELDDEEAAVGVVAVGEAEEVDEAGAVEGGEDVDFVVELVGGGGGFLDGDEATAAEDGFVDEAVAAAAEELGVGEVAGGLLEVFVVEFLDFDGLGFGFGFGCGDGGICFAGEVTH